MNEVPEYYTSHPFDSFEPDAEDSPTSINVSQEERILSLIGGALLGGLGVWKRGPLGIAAIGAGIVLLYQGLVGDSPIYRALGRNSAVASPNDNVTVPHKQGVHLTRAITVNRSASDLYAFWRDPLHYPQTFDFIESVEITGPDRAHWVIVLPGGLKAHLDVEVFTDVPNEVISWRSLPESQIQHAGSIRFRPAPGSQGTEAQLTVEFVPPGGPLAQAVLKLFGDAPSQYLMAYLYQFKQRMETGETATTEGQTSGRIDEITPPEGNPT